MAVKLMPVAPIGSTTVAEPATPAEAEKPREPRKKRRAAVYDADGHEVLITLKCLKCGRMHPLSNFGLRRMADGAIRNQPWCRECRGASSPKKKKGEGAPLDASADTAPTMPVAEQAEQVQPSEPQVAPPAQPPIPSTPSGPMQVVPLTAEQVLRALATSTPSAQPAELPANEPAPSEPDGEGEPS